MENKKIIIINSVSMFATIIFLGVIYLLGMVKLMTSGELLILSVITFSFFHLYLLLRFVLEKVNKK